MVGFITPIGHGTRSEKRDQVVQAVRRRLVEVGGLMGGFINAVAG